MISAIVSVVTYSVLTHSKRVDLSSTGLVAVPPATDTDTQDLILDNNYITEINQSSFNSYKKLVFISLENNSMDTISGCPFQSPVREIILKQNRLTTFPNLCCIGEYLQVLRLGSNLLTVINSSHTSCLRTSLTEIHVDNNYLLDITGLVGLKKLSTFIADHNSIVVLAFTGIPSVFYALQSLRRVELGYNALYRLPRDVFWRTAVSTVKLGGNDLTQFPCLDPRSYRITSLCLAYNNISHVPTNITSYLTRLTHLDLTGNPISCMDEVTKTNIFLLCFNVLI